MMIDGTIGTVGTIECTLGDPIQIVGEIFSDMTITGEIYCTPSIYGYIDKLYISPEGSYQGDYTVVPKVTAQTLETQGLRMQDNVSILRIPYYQTLNPQGGNTVYIADSI